MKKIILILIMLAPFFSEAKNVWAFLTYSTFNSPEGPYIETYLTVAGNSVKYVKKDNGKFQATVDILMTFKQDTIIKAFKKYELKSPEIADTTKSSYEFIDEQRFLLPNGTYNFVLQLADKNNPGKSNPFSQAIVVDYPSDKPCFSGIQLVKTVSKSETETIITKNGYDLVPNVYNYYSPEDKHMTFYCELYNMDKVIPAGQKFILTYYIQSYENNMKFNDLAQLKTETAKPVNVVLSDFNIENLATGQYNLVIEAINQKNEIVASQKLFIQRSNPNAQLTYDEMLSNKGSNSFVEKITNRDTLKEYISSTFPISSGLERSFIRNVLKSMDLQRLQDYFYGFWMRRDKADPEHAWLLYNEQVKKVQYNFGTRIKKGYQTDRGRVYLEYGPPNTTSSAIL